MDGHGRTILGMNIGPQPAAAQRAEINRLSIDLACRRDEELSKQKVPGLTHE
jgi:hypothetical protein